MGRSIESGCEKWLVVNEVPTCIQVWGGWAEEEITTDSVILIITGNPGITDFYVGFMKDLHMKCGDYPVWVIGQAGHVSHPDNPPLSERPELYDLKGQVNHKKEFIQRFIPKDKNIILMGHSIGAKICVELLKDESISCRVDQTHLMMPCLENIGESRNGYWFQRIGVRIFPFFCWIARVLTGVPVAVKLAVLKFLSALRFRTRNFDECVLHGVIKLGVPGIIEQAIFLAKDEMLHVKGLDDEVYEIFGSRMFAYYGQRDGWSPLTHYENLRKRHWNVRAVVLNHEVEHAFMVRNSSNMADEVVLSMKILSSSKSSTCNKTCLRLLR